ncbi:alpha/beta hydrolase family protein [Kutzneria sp. NPDC052558]|uniref:alpha/beta hydrolase family protein n=1 Tax=Kutzneria sp. NPDC052558 TaxID=3364121 RepID=UPI0037C86859
MNEMIRGTAAGVPFLARPPERATSTTPLVLGWHMMDPPRSEAAMAAAVPMAAVPAWRVYLGLPEHGERAPAGGQQEITRRAAEDYVLKLIDPVVSAASGEFPVVLHALRSRLETDGPLGLFGGSAGGAVALQVLTEQDVDVTAAALVNPVAQLEKVADGASKWFGTPYPWTAQSRAAAARLDFVARAGELAKRHPDLALLLVRGDRDEPEFREPLGALARALDAELVDVPGMEHSLAAEIDATRVDAAFSDWFRRHLIPPLL